MLNSASGGRRHNTRNGVFLLNDKRKGKVVYQNSYQNQII